MTCPRTPSKGGAKTQAGGTVQPGYASLEEIKAKGEATNTQAREAVARQLGAVAASG